MINRYQGLNIRKSIFFLLALVSEFAAYPHCAFSEDKAEDATPKVESKSILYLTTCKPFENEKYTNKQPKHHVTLLSRELLRQAFLITAREDFGLLTRDETLREPIVPTADGMQPYFLDIDLNEDQIDLTVIRNKESVFKHSFSLKAGKVQNYEMVLGNLCDEATREVFPEVFLKANLKKRDRPYSTDAEIPSSMLGILKNMDTVSQYHAIRLAHERMEVEGESEALLGAIAMGYANLSQLTMYHHTSSSEAFAARAILYASRLIHHNPNVPQGYWYRAYVYTMCGYTNASIKDLETAVKLVETNKSDPIPDPPMWLSLLTPANRFDYMSLSGTTEGNGDNAVLASFLAFRAVETSDSQALALEMGKQALQRNQTCLRITDGMHRVAGVSYRHTLTTIPFRIQIGSVMNAFPPLVKGSEEVKRILEKDGIPQLPDPQIILQPTGMPILGRKIVELETENTDRQEPSLSVLGRLIEEDAMTQIINRIKFIRCDQGVSADDLVMAFSDAIEGYRWGPLIKFYHSDYYRNPAAFNPLFKNLVIDEVRFYANWTLLDRMAPETQFKNTTKDQMWRLLWNNSSKNDLNCIFYINTVVPKAKTRYANIAELYQPHLPKRYVTLVQYDWENSKDKVGAWIEEQGYHPDILKAAGYKYESQKEYDKVEVLLKKYLDTVADFDVYVKLADVYYRQGKLEETTQLASQFLEQEDYALQHASMSHKMARTLMGEGKYEEALPWAERAAASGAGWGTQVYADCFEVLGDKDKVKEARIEIRDHYNSFSNYYEFVARTGLGDLESAYQDVRKYYVSRVGAQSPAVEELDRKQLLYQGKYKEAMEAFRKLHLAEKDPYYGLLVASLAAREGDNKVRDESLERVANLDIPLHAKEYWNGVARYNEMGKVLQAAWKDDLEELPRVDELAAEEWGISHRNIHYFAAAYYEARGDKKRAIHHYQEVAKAPEREKFTVVSAWVRLRELGEDPFKLKPYYSGFTTPEMEKISREAYENQLEADKAKEENRKAGEPEKKEKAEAAKKAG